MPNISSDYVPNYKKKFVPHTGHLEGGWPYKAAFPEGYRANHNMFGMKSLIQASLFNPARWGGASFNINKMVKPVGKVVALLAVLLIIDPYGMRKMKRRLKAEKGE